MIANGKTVVGCIQDFIGWLYVTNNGRLSEDESSKFQRVLLACNRAWDENADSEKLLLSVGDDVLTVCQWLEDSHGILPFTHPDEWEMLRKVRGFYGVDMQAASEYGASVNVAQADPFGVFPQGTQLIVDVVAPGEYRIGLQARGIKYCPGRDEHYTLDDAIRRALVFLPNQNRQEVT